MLNIAIPTKTQLTTSLIEPQKDQSMTKDRMRLKYGFINESKKLLDKLPQSMRYVGKPELLSDTFIETKLDSIEDDKSETTSLTSRDLQ